MNINKKLFEDQNYFLLDVKEPFMVNEFLKEVHRTLPEYRLDVCYSIEDFLVFYHRGGMFSSEKRILVLWDFTREHVDVIESLMSVPTDDIIVLVRRGAISKTKAYTRITTDFTTVKLEKPTERGCSTWVRDKLKEYGVECQEKVPSYIVSHLGTNMYALDSVLKKLRVLGRNISVDECARLISQTHEARYFDFMDSLFRRRVSSTLQEFSKVDESSYVQLIHFMIGQIERIYRVACLKNQGESIEDISEILGVPKFIMKTKMMPAVASFGRVKLIKLLDLVNELEKVLRVTKLPKDQVFQSYLLKAMKT
ncbi:MAG: hypothetical protein GF334_06265 [Candidatus Altiarchaeales archaeon]|nr:hypothetical protein [Candidatus Altiarchaeales archaeon]